MGNICRSPSAEGFLRHYLAQSPSLAHVQTDSAGTHSYHLGSPPDSRAISTAANLGIDISDLRARRVSDSDFSDFDLILAMDEANLATLERMREYSDLGQGHADLRLMMEFSPRFSTIREVPDPYYGGSHDFIYMCELLDEATRGLLDHLGEFNQRGESLGRPGD